MSSYHQPRARGRESSQPLPGPCPFFFWLDQDLAPELLYMLLRAFGLLQCYCIWTKCFRPPLPRPAIRHAQELGTMRRTARRPLRSWAEIDVGPRERCYLITGAYYVISGPKITLLTSSFALSILKLKKGRGWQIKPSIQNKFRIVVAFIRIINLSEQDLTFAIFK